jgi:SNF2 family DNA or RNA helicase
MTPWWNIANELQAFGRVKRHGQTKETILVRLIAKDTIDEKMIKTQEKKKAEIADVLTPGKKPRSFTAKDYYNLLVDESDEEEDMESSATSDDEDDSDYC